MGGPLTRREEQIEDEFLNVPLRAETMTFYTVRTGILERVTEVSKLFRGTVLDVGCGFMPYRKIILSNESVERYIGMDVPDSAVYAGSNPDLTWDGDRIPMADHSVDGVFATEFLEHHPDPDGALREMYRVLRPGGIVFITVPFIWNLHEVPHDEYRYTPYSVERHLRTAGFTGIEVRAIGGWNRALAQMLGLWLGFSEMGDRRRRFLRRAALPFYRWLVNHDVTPRTFDGGANSMFCGLSALAIK